MDADQPPWTVTLVCGASGIGKTSVAAPLAVRYGAPLTATDDIVTALRAVSTPEQMPALHVWDTRPEAWSWPPERIADLHLEVVRAMRPAFAAVIADHVESDAPVVLEGDHLAPDLAIGFGAAVRAVVLDEPDEDRLVANYLAREPGGGEQRRRALVSLALGAGMRASAARVGVPVVAVRPWADAVDRVDRALRGAA